MHLSGGGSLVFSAGLNWYKLFLFVTRKRTCTFHPPGGIPGTTRQRFSNKQKKKFLYITCLRKKGLEFCVLSMWIYANCLSEVGELLLGSLWPKECRHLIMNRANKDWEFRGKKNQSRLKAIWKWLQPSNTKQWAKCNWISYSRAVIKVIFVLGSLCHKHTVRC